MKIRPTLFTIIISLALIPSACTSGDLTSDRNQNAPISDSQAADKDYCSFPQDGKQLPSSVPATNKSSSRTLSWYILRNKEHQPPRINAEIGFDIADHQAYYLGSSEKKIFLTFDQGYENGYTLQILDTLKKTGVKAAFFVTESYIRENPDLIKKMINEGHIVGNHSKTHPSMPSLSGRPQLFLREFTDTEQAYQEVSGQEMPKFFRPPRGEYSEKSLQMTKQLGYKTIFWSFAYEDWLTDKQPGEEAAYQKIMQNTHPGEIMLLHAVSSTNAKILEKVITAIKKEGYEFAPLTELDTKLKQANK